MKLDEKLKSEDELFCPAKGRFRPFEIKNVL